MEKSNENAAVIGALLLGAAIGGALGVIFAPDKGSETRKKLVGAGEGVADDLERKVADFLEELKRETKTSTQKVKDNL